ncbi:hypothetical protein PJIAN_1660 [Paludibacter jiangxiensis]|uniref:Uncharacterized protein n=2 Tax=Paludibacter jiangxiensis TaxID=681398 RepID=A0A170YUB4_9BACT|nr:hypothetical protein PJIAN_1660 [Paludibacter jiangxiensis]
MYFCSLIQKSMRHFIHKITPRISRHNLLLAAACMWLFAGGMLLWRSCAYFEPVSGWPWLLILSFIGGLLFFRGMFLRISNKHINRIRKMKIERPCLFSFFNLRSYGIMVVMISGGVGLRTSHLIALPYLSLFYLFMSIPLLLSAVRFVRAWLIY